MKNECLLAVGLIALASTVTAAPSSPSHCSHHEENLFSCRIGQKFLSFCSPRTADDQHPPAWIQYRYGRIGATELVFPAEKTSPVDHFRFTSANGGRWVDNTVQFSINEHTYTVKAYGNSNIPEAEGSVLVVSPDGSRKRLGCINPGVNAAAGLWRFQQFQLRPAIKELAD